MVTARRGAVCVCWPFGPSSFAQEPTYFKSVSRGCVAGEDGVFPHRGSDPPNARDVEVVVLGRTFTIGPRWIVVGGNVVLATFVMGARLLALDVRESRSLCAVRARYGYGGGRVVAELRRPALAAV